MSRLCSLKRIRQMLDRSEPRSMWHRPTCQTLRQCWICPLAALAFAGAILVVVLVVYIVLFALVPFVCKASILLGLDDSVHVLQNITLTLESALDPHYRGLAQSGQSLLVILCGVTGYLILHLALLGRWKDATGALLCLVVIPLAPAIVIICCVVPFSAVGGFPAVSFEFVKQFMHLLGLKSQTPMPDAYTEMSRWFSILYDPNAGFYTQLAALCALVGLTCGITIIISAILLYPIYGCVCVVKRDIEDTARDIV